MNGAKTWVEINQQALRSNIAALRSLLSEGTAMAGVVKSNAYGHGLQQVVPIMLQEGLTTFCVDNIDEGIAVRTLAPNATVIILGYTLHERLNHVIRYRLDQTIYDLDTLAQLQELAKAANERARVHVKIETGTMRQGIWPEELPAFIAALPSSPNVDLVGVSSHFANVEEAESPAFAEYQLSRFVLACETLQAAGIDPPLKHIACSAAVILYPQTHGSLVRPGVSTYGFWSSRETRHAARQLGRRIELDPVLQWKTYIAQVKEAPMNAPVGYGSTEILRRHSKIAVLPIGYWDGYDRRLSSVGEVLVRGQLCKVLGRVCMNMCMVDVTEVPRVGREDEVVLIGRAGKNRMRADDLADRTGSIHYEVTTRINPNIPRIIV